MRKARRDGSHSAAAVGRLKSPIGELLIGAEAGGVCFIDFDIDELPRLGGSPGAVEAAKAEKVVELAKEELGEYFSGRLKKFSVGVAQGGSKFEMLAWRALQEIPYGETISYEEEARRAGSPRGFRAVGNANAKNSIPIIVPCHRVIAKGGGLGGYSGGLWRKEFLLKLEMENRQG